MAIRQKATLQKKILIVYIDLNLMVCSCLLKLNLQNKINFVGGNKMADMSSSAININKLR